MHWDDLPGGTRVKKILAGILFSKRIANAYLFTGFDPDLKLRYSRFLGQALLCQEAEDLPCGKCASCLKFDKGLHPDFMVIQPEGTAIKIDQLRQLKSYLTYGAYEGGYLVVVMRGADTMTVEAANSFLKILEEPAPGVVYLLLADREEGVPLTIVSRCQKIVFEEGKKDDMAGKELIVLFEKKARRGRVQQFELAEELLQNIEDPKELLLALISGYGQVLKNSALGDFAKINEGVAKMRILFDAFRKTNLHVNKRLLLETVILKWGKSNEIFSN